MMQDQNQVVNTYTKNKVKLSCFIFFSTFKQKDVLMKVNKFF